MDEDILTALKIVIIGESAVGKSSLSLRFVEDKFNHEQPVTIGIDSNTKRLTIDSNTVKLTIWDIADHEKFLAFRTLYYPHVQGAIIVFDVSRYNTFTKLEQWLNELDTYSTKNNIVKMIIGNKIDVEKREVSREEAMQFARRHQTLYIEASAKTKDGVQSAFEELVHKIIQTPVLWESYASDNIHIEIKDRPPQSRCNVV